jgi:hypothetical protein
VRHASSPTPITLTPGTRPSGSTRQWGFDSPSAYCERCDRGWDPRTANDQASRTAVPQGTDPSSGWSTAGVGRDGYGAAVGTPPMLLMMSMRSRLSLSVAADDKHSDRTRLRRQPAFQRFAW